MCNFNLKTKTKQLQRPPGFLQDVDSGEKETVILYQKRSSACKATGLKFLLTEREDLTASGVV